jgi:hypothetical protein
MTPPEEKALEERSHLYRRYRKAQAAYRKELFEKHPKLAEFAQHLHRYQITNAAELIAHVREVVREGWLTSSELRVEALSLVDERIIAIREKAGLPPFDDPLPDQPDKAFQAIKRELTG